MEWSQNIVAGRKNQPLRQPLFTPRGPKTTQPKRDSKSPGNSVSISPSTSSGRMLDTVENGRVLWAAGDGRAALSLSRVAVLWTSCA